MLIKPNHHPDEFHLDAPDFSDRKAGIDVLLAWQQARLAIDRTIRDWQRGDPRVTVLSYYFRDQDPGAVHLGAIECAILETWRHCGRLQAVIVSDRPNPPLERLATQHDEWLSVQIEPALKPGNLFSMSVDCNSRLYRRFDTDYVLIVQEDGFPLRHGLEHFVGRYDFIGAPNVRNKWYLQAFCRLFKCLACNGGFSLRSHRSCELAAHYWEKKYHRFPDCPQVSEDYFFSMTLPLREPAYRRQVSLPTFAEANDFSYDPVFPFVSARPPFGFHGALAFKLLYEAGAVERLPQEQAIPGPPSQ